AATPACAVTASAGQCSLARTSGVRSDRRPVGDELPARPHLDRLHVEVAAPGRHVDLGGVGLEVRGLPVAPLVREDDGPQGAVLLVLDELAVHDQLAHALDGDMVAPKRSEERRVGTEGTRLSRKWTEEAKQV